jgi:hypothetical protein
VEFATKFEMVVNLKAAKALGLEIPAMRTVSACPGRIRRADDVRRLRQGQEIGASDAAGPIATAEEGGLVFEVVTFSSSKHHHRKWTPLPACSHPW